MYIQDTINVKTSKSWKSDVKYCYIEKLLLPNNIEKLLPLEKKMTSDVKYYDIEKLLPPNNIEKLLPLTKKFMQLVTKLVLSIIIWFLQNSNIFVSFL